MYLESHIASNPREGSHTQSTTLLHELFEMQAAARPDHIAVEYGDEQMTYGELDIYSNQIAQYLRRKGVKPGALVGLYLSKSTRLYAAILGVLKAGAGYIPIDPKFPMERVNDILTDSDAFLAISEGSLADDLVANVSITAVRLDQEHAQISVEPRKSILSASIGLNDSDVCYVIYTSGSTGRPKGVMIEHRNALAFVSSLSTVYQLTQNERIYQGFSVAFDASVEEIWAAFSLGNTLVVPEESISRSPLDTSEFIAKNKITFFSTIPTFLAMIDREMPTLTTLILGGEVCTPELVQRWAKPGCRMLNTYGPTETTVIATWAECSPDKPVTIGTPIPGYEAYVLNEDQKPVKMGEVGELYVGGPGVARGYCKREELTAERFIQNPFKPADIDAKVYRTFDLVSVNEQGQIEFVGRCDGQIKIRGFRVELPEIESVLIEQNNIRAAAVRVVEKDGIKDLAAYVVADKDIDRAEISENMRARLPEYMIPKYLDITPALPLTNSGKVDRNQLPDPVEPLLSLDRDIVAPSNKMEEDVLSAWKKCLGLDTISIEDDFFDDLQGHSLAAAKVTSELRVALGNSGLSVRDVYRNRTIRAYAASLEGKENTQVSSENKNNDTPDKSLAQVQFENVPVWERYTVTVLQGISLLVYFGILFAPVAYATIIGFKVYSGELAWETVAGISTALAFAWWPAMLALSIVVKWTVIGRFKPGRYPLWGMYYYRWWLVTLVQKLNWSEVFVGTPLMNIYYRAMGAKIGRNVVIDTNLCNAFDVVSIGDHSCVGSETQILGYRVENGQLVIDQVYIGENCFVGMHCNLGLGAAMENGARLDDMSALKDNQHMAAGEGRRGAPSVSANVSVPEGLDAPASTARRFLFGTIHLALIYVMGYFLIGTMLPGLALIVGALMIGGVWLAIPAALLSAPLFMAVYTGALWVVKKLLIGKVQSGTYRLESAHYLRHWFLEYMMRNTRMILLPVYATIYMSGLLRILGAKIGDNSEVSTVMNVSPDLLTVGEGTFLADACLIGGVRIFNGVFETQETKIGSRTFIGNSAFVPAGSNIGDDVLIGVMSTPPVGQEVEPGSRWLGSPGFALPNTQRNICFATETLSKPTPALKRSRAIIDAIRIILPGILRMIGLIITVALLGISVNLLPLWVTILSVPVIGTLVSLWMIEVSAQIKHLVSGELKPTVQPLWCHFVWMNELVNGVYESVAAPAMNPLLGTPFIAPALRAMGTKVGVSTYIETTLFSEFDLVEIKDYAALNLGATVQNHLFEDRVFKADRLTIGEGATVSNMAVVLYDTTMEKGSHLGPMSVLMKGEKLPEFSQWAGIPCEAMDQLKKELPELHHTHKATIYLSTEIILKRIRNINVIPFGRSPKEKLNDLDKAG